MNNKIRSLITMINNREASGESSYDHLDLLIELKHSVESCEKYNYKVPVELRCLLIGIALGVAIMAGM